MVRIDDMSKKILIVSEIFHPESSLINDFVVELVKQGFEVEVLTQHPSYPDGKVFDGYSNSDYSIEMWNSIKIHRFKVIEGYRESKIKKILNYWTFVREGRKIAHQIGGDFDHILIYQTGPLTLALPAIAIKKKYGTKLTIWTFDIWPDAVYAYGFPKVFPLTVFLNSIITTVYKNSDNIFVSSKAFAQTIQRYVAGKKIDYAPNWLIPQSHRLSSLQLSADKFNFTFTGNISMAQNLENVIRGWEASQIAGEATLNIIGNGSSLAVLKLLVEKENIEGVIFHGHYPADEMYAILSNSDMLLLSLISDPGVTKTEPFKLQSYLNAGRPIFGVINGAGKQIIEDSQLGICVDPDDVAAIATGFRAAMEFADQNRAEILLRAQVLLNGRFNREKTISKIIKTISQ